MDGVGKKKKVRQMIWCIAEARRLEHMKCLKKAVCVSISEDKRGTRFLLRYKACDQQLNVTKGVVALLHLVGSPDLNGADSLRSATLKGLQHACTRISPPFRTEPDPQTDTDMYQDLLKKVESFAADGAGDEHLAARELGSHLGMCGENVRPLQDHLAQFLPGLKVAWRRDCFSCDGQCVNHWACNTLQTSGTSCFVCSSATPPPPRPLFTPALKLVDAPLSTSSPKGCVCCWF